jgi:ubiquinone/menaquinone biosynthesis C-methylase UbiE
MGLWRTIIFPRLLDTCVATPFEQYRQPIVAQATGQVLEVGFGTGLNIPYYPPHVIRITALDANPGMFPVAQKRIAASSIRVDPLVGNGEHLAFADNIFDTVVSTWTLCSIPNVQQALREIYRVLKPAGCFVFIEHGLGWEPQIQAWQHRLTPVQKKLADGCHLDRNIQMLVTSLAFELQRLDQFYAEQMPKVFGALYVGVARKP